MFDFCKRFFGNKNSTSSETSPEAKKYVRYFKATGEMSREYIFISNKLPVGSIGYELYEKNTRGVPIKIERFYYGEEVSIMEVRDAWNEITELEAAGFTRGLKLDEGYYILVHKNDHIIPKKCSKS